MGRRRKPRNKKREVVSITLDRDVLDAFDNTLGDRTRSRAIESLIRRSLQAHSEQTAFVEHVWECSSCGHQWRTNRPTTTVSKCPGCRDYVFEEAYRGVWEEEE
jgi:predicted Zn-ribbon and HTH transcriptional regulator